MLKDEVFYHLSLVSYFDHYGLDMSVSDMIQMILSDEELAEDYNEYKDFQYNLEILKDIPLHAYDSIKVKDCFNDNLHSGVVFYVFETEEELIFAIRGSEALDDIHHSTGWQDWMDNFRMFLKPPTPQQLITQHQIQQYPITKPYYLCGHSKGGNLALFSAITLSTLQLENLKGVISFNAPGITRPIMEMYQERIQDKAFLNKITLFENENDCISSYYEHVKEPFYIKSNFPCNTLEQLFHNHNLYAMDFKGNQYIYANKKTAIPKVVYHFVNDFFVNLKEERLERVVARMDDYFKSDLSMNELYRVLIYHISQYTSLFEDIEYDEIKTITFQDLIDRRKTKNVMGKVKEIQPKEAIKKVADMIGNVNPIAKLNELDVKVITQGIIDNYDLLKKDTTKNLQEKLRFNNETVTNAIKAIRSRKENE